MSWAGEAVAALRKIITLEERVATLTEDIHELTRMVRDLDHRVVKMETKFEVYERLSEKPGPAACHPKIKLVESPDRIPLCG